MRQTDVIKWVAEEVVTIYNDISYLSLSQPSQHVGLANDRDTERYPFVGIQKIATATSNAGIGNGQLHVVDIQYQNGLADAIVYGRDSTLRLNVIPVTDNDQQLRDKLLGDIEDHLLLYTRDERTVPDDMDEPTVTDATPQDRAEEFVYADGIAIEIPYTRTITDDSITAAEAVNLDIDVGEDIDDIDEWGDEKWSEKTWESADAFDEQV